MRNSELLLAIRSAREVTMPAGALVALLTGCGTCKAVRGERCRSYTWPDAPPSNQVHMSRRLAAIDLIRRGPK